MEHERSRDAHVAQRVQDQLIPAPYRHAARRLPHPGNLFLPLAEPHDELRITELPGSEGFSLTCSLPELDPQGNTVAKAYRLYAEATGFAPACASTWKKASRTVRAWGAAARTRPVCCAT